MGEWQQAVTKENLKPNLSFIYLPVAKSYLSLQAQATLLDKKTSCAASTSHVQHCLQPSPSSSSHLALQFWCCWHKTLHGSLKPSLLSETVNCSGNWEIVQNAQLDWAAEMGQTARRKRRWRSAFSDFWVLSASGGRKKKTDVKFLKWGFFIASAEGRQRLPFSISIKPSP